MKQVQRIQMKFGPATFLFGPFLSSSGTIHKRILEEIRIWVKTVRKMRFVVFTLNHKVKITGWSNEDELKGFMWPFWRAPWRVFIQTNPSKYFHPGISLIYSYKNHIVVRVHQSQATSTSTIGLEIFSKQLIYSWHKKLNQNTMNFVVLAIK